MSSSFFYLKEGLMHITDIGAYDHILFIAAMATLYSFKEWKPLLLLVTAFTVGHSIALALATLELVEINSSIVEFLIPVTIILTAIGNLILSRYLPETNNGSQIENDDVLDLNTANEETNTSSFHVEQLKKSYLIVLFFGVIHGLGFSNYLRFMLASDETITIPLLLFNVGLEIGQILILTIVLLINLVFLNIFNISKKTWVWVLSFLIIGISLPILVETGKVIF